MDHLTEPEIRELLHMHFKTLIGGTQTMPAEQFNKWLLRCIALAEELLKREQEA